MNNKKNEPEFVVTDRRRFTSEGEVSRQETAEKEPVQPQAPAPPADAAPSTANTQTARTAPGAEAPQYQPPTERERKAQADAFQATTSRLDKELEGALGGRAQDFQMTFERFVASLYMSALFQLGLMREQDSTTPPQVDLVGARQTIDTIAILADKTKGNLSAQEENLVQNCLYELRMAYVEVTNALTRGPQPGAEGGAGGRK